MYRWIGGLATVLVALGVGVGCGGGSEETGSTVTKVAYVKKADFICADSKQERAAIGEETYNPKQRQGPHEVGGKSTKELEAELEKLAEKLLTEKIIPSLKDQQKKLEDIGVPAADDEQLENMMVSLEKAIGELEEEGYKGLFGNQFDDFEKEAETYGLKCKVI